MPAGGESGARGVSRLEIIRSGPIGTFPDAEYHFFRKSCQHCDNAPCVRLPHRGLPYPQGGWHRRRQPGSLRRLHVLSGCLPLSGALYQPCDQGGRQVRLCRKTNLAAGKEPACVESCPTKALVFGNLDDPNSPIAKRLVKETTYRYKQALGTSPKMYRVPKGEIKS